MASAPRIDDTTKAWVLLAAALIEQGSETDLVLTILIAIADSETGDDIAQNLGFRQGFNVERLREAARRGGYDLDPDHIRRLLETAIEWAVSGPQLLAAQERERQERAAAYAAKSRIAAREPRA